MDFRDHWIEHMEWLVKSIKELRRMALEAKTPSIALRLEAKADGLNVALQHMKDTIRIYELGD